MHKSSSIYQNTFFPDDHHLQAIQGVVDVPRDILFPNNASQEKAIRKALSSSFSLIHGPPGKYAHYKTNR